MKNRQTQAKACKEKNERAKMLKERQARSVGIRLSSRLKQKHKESQRDITLNSMRQAQNQELEAELNGFDFLFSFGGLC